MCVLIYGSAELDDGSVELDDASAQSTSLITTTKLTGQLELEHWLALTVGWISTFIPHKKLIKK